MQTVDRQTCTPCPCPCPPTGTAQNFRDTTGGVGVFATGPHSILNLVASSQTTGVWFLILDKATAPVNGDVPIWEVFIASGSAFRMDWDGVPLKVTSGFAFAWSSTSAVVTTTATGNVAAVGQYV